MQFFARRLECKHIVWAGPLANTAATLQLADELRGRSCPTCGEEVRRVDFVAMGKPTSGFDEPPPPRNAENKLKKASKADARKTGRRLAELGAETDGLAAELRDAAVGLTPPDWRGTLGRIPVGRLWTYEPNAECIRFKDSPVPAIVFHQGLASCLFKLNRSIFPLIRMASMQGAVHSLVADRKTRSALQVQAVDTALEFLGVGSPRSKVLVDIPTLARFLEMPLTRTMSSFVLCHEYGHAVLNHADELREAGRDGKVYLLERSRAMEFEADTWGQDAVTGAFTGGENLESSLDMLDDLFGSDASLMKHDISHAAPCVTLLYFEFLDAVEERLTRHGVDVTAQSAPLRGYRRHARAAASAGSAGSAGSAASAASGAPGQSTHPSNQERFQALYGYLSDHGNFTAHTWVEGFEVLLDEIKADLDTFIDRTGAVTGTRLTPRFRLPRRKARRTPGSTSSAPGAGSRSASGPWRDTITDIDDDEDTRIKLQEALREVKGQEFALDEAALRRHFEEQKGRAEAHFDKKEYAEAEKIYTQILEAGEWTESVMLYPWLGMCREELGDRQGAMAAFRRCLEIVPGSDPAALCGFWLGRMLLFDEKDPSGAEPALTAATTSHSPGVRLQAMYWLGETAHKRRDVEVAMGWYRKIWAERDTELDVFHTVVAHAALNMGSVFEARGDLEQAVKMFEYGRDFRGIEPNNRAVAEKHLRAIRGR